MLAPDSGALVMSPRIQHGSKRLLLPSPYPPGRCPRLESTLCGISPGEILAFTGLTVKILSGRNLDEPQQPGCQRAQAVVLYLKDNIQTLTIPHLRNSRQAERGKYALRGSQGCKQCERRAVGCLELKLQGQLDRARSADLIKRVEPAAGFTKQVSMQIEAGGRMSRCW